METKGSFICWVMSKTWSDIPLLSINTLDTPYDLAERTGIKDALLSSDNKTIRTLDHLDKQTIF
jgi:hypothetical protein